MEKPGTNPERLGLSEVATGTVAGATVAHLLGKALADKPIKAIESRINTVAVDAAATFNEAHPMPLSVASGLSDQAAKAWMEESHAAVRAAVAPLEKEAAALANPLTRPFLAFKNAPIQAQVGMGAAITAGALGAGWLMNKWRNSGAASHVERLERERDLPPDRSR